jgi:U4/U6 small nuclear ribonucleoprotein PRP4
MHSSIQIAKASGHVNISADAKTTVMELSDASKAEQAMYKSQIRSFEVKKRARNVIVPTAIEEVKSMLRQYGEPITLFGEGPYDRRERLRETIAGIEADKESGIDASSNNNEDDMNDDNEKKMKSRKVAEIVYSNATDDLINIRTNIALYSFDKSNQRLIKRKNFYNENDIDNNINVNIINDKVNMSNLYTKMSGMKLDSTSTPESRPLVKICCAPNNMPFTVTGSLGTHATLWKTETVADSNTLIPVASLLKGGHTERLMALSWHPEAFSSSNSSAMLATASVDGRCMLWDCREGMSNNSVNSGSNGSGTATPAIAPIKILEGHKGAVTDCAFHPNGQLLATSGVDYSWRLYDCETSQNVLIQDGHVNECSALSIQSDGALIMTCDSGGVILLWDMRSGQKILTFHGHIEKITSCDFNSNGYLAVTSSIDNQVRVWDIRHKRCNYMLPAHSQAITRVKYSTNGEMLLTSSFDSTVKLWTSRGHRLLNTLVGHTGKVMAADFHSNDDYIVTAGFDRTVKLWN